MIGYLKMEKGVFLFLVELEEMSIILIMDIGNDFFYQFLEIMDCLK